MIPKEILAKIRRIEITTSHLVSDVFAGAYHSVFKGRGMEFDEVREYQMGDDIRSIDWNVTARTGVAHVKKYVEERELTVMVLVDASASTHFGSVKELKNTLAAEIAAVLAFSAIRNNDKVGLMIFTGQIELFIPPRKGKSHVLRVIREALYFQPRGRATDINGALEYLTKVMRRKSVVFVISDFFENDQSAGGGFQKSMRIANKYHDVIAITLNDPREAVLPRCALVELADAETGRRVVVDTSDERVRLRYQRQAAARLDARGRLFQAMGVDHIDVHTHGSYAKALIGFFAQRRRRQ
ncbi:MAG: DUF58 domain-containing protein [Candidatus Omnitrophica bacterium]|nr:DUF58 domain-containing protein [Candidatus Omnitrophota bacterium]